VDPVDLTARYGTDTLRWWLVREVGPHADADFTESRLVDRADRELARGLGNLVNRTVSLVHRYRDGRVPDVAPERSIDALPARVDDALHRFDLRATTDAIWAEVEEATARWIGSGRGSGLATATPGSTRCSLHRCRAVVAECRPCVPGTAARLAAQLGAGGTVGRPGPALPARPRRWFVDRGQFCVPARSATCRSAGRV
jgi:methionyl-tRNA synthetase